MRGIAPFFVPNKASVGANIDGKEPYQGAGYAYPVLIAMDSQDADFVYNMTKAMVELFDTYNGKAPGIGGWAMEKQDFEWVVPYHEGAIRYFKEVGVWTDAAQANNDKLVARQKALAAAWKEFEAKGVAEDEWDETWAEHRRKALKDGGFSVVF